MMSDKLTNSEIDARREAFDKAGYWPNEVLWKVWSQAWDAARLANAQGEAVACIKHSVELVGEYSNIEIFKELAPLTKLYAHPPMPQLDGRYAPESFPTKFAEPSTALPDEPQRYSPTLDGKMVDDPAGRFMFVNQHLQIIDALRAHCLKEPK